MQFQCIFSRSFGVITKNMYSKAAQLCTVKASALTKMPLAKTMQYIYASVSKRQNFHQLKKQNLLE